MSDDALQPDVRNLAGALQLAALGGFVLIAAHHSGLLSVGRLGLVLSAFSLGVLSGSTARHRPEPTSRARLAQILTWVVAGLIMTTAVLALVARFGLDSAQYSALRGSGSWLWFLCSDIHAISWGLGGWESGAADSTVGMAALCSVIRPSILWLALGYATRLSVRKAREVAQVLLLISAVAGVLAVPGESATHVFYMPEWTFFAGMAGVLVALAPSKLFRAPGIEAGLLPSGISKRLGSNGAAVTLTAWAAGLVMLGPLNSVLPQSLAAGPRAMVLLLSCLVVGFGIAVGLDSLRRARISGETCAIVLPPLVVLCVLALWQATAAFTFEPPYFL